MKIILLSEHSKDGPEALTLTSLFRSSSYAGMLHMHVCWMMACKNICGVVKTVCAHCSKNTEFKIDFFFFILHTEQLFLIPPHPKLKVHKLSPRK